MEADIINVLFIDLTPFYGGGQKFLKTVSQQFSERISPFYLVCNEKIYNEIEAVHKFMAPDSLLSQIHFANNLLKKNNIDVVFLNGNRPIYFAPLLKCRFKIAYKHTSNNAFSGVKKFFGVFALHLCYVFCDKIVLLYEKAMNDIMFFKTKVVIINNGIDLGEVPVNKVLHNKVRFVCVTRLDGNKGLEWLIPNFHYAFSKFINDVELIIVGDGPLKTTILDKIDKLNIQNVILTGFLEDVDQILATADVFIFPSKFESFPLSILEAMKYCLPIIATDTGGISEMVIDGENGRLITYLDDEGIKSAMADLFQNKLLRELYGNNSGNFVKQKFSLANSIKKIESIIYDAHKQIT